MPPNKNLKPDQQADTTAPTARAPTQAHTAQACLSCSKGPPTVKLRRCTKCWSVEYCSKDCQKAHWKTHRKDCAPGVAPEDSQPSPPAGSPTRDGPGLFNIDMASGTITLGAAPSAISPPHGLDGSVDKPFNRLINGTWLHDRSEKDVYRLLVDAYRMRIEDEWVFAGDGGGDTIYGGCASSIAGFRVFLNNAERTQAGPTGKRVGILPAWWNRTKRLECERLGITASGASPCSFACLPRISLERIRRGATEPTCAP